MYLQDYQKPGDRVTTTVLDEKTPLPVNMGRRWLMLCNASKTAAQLSFQSEGPVALTIPAGKTVVLPSPVYLGAVWVISGTVNASEM